LRHRHLIPRSRRPRSALRRCRSLPTSSHPLSRHRTCSPSALFALRKVASRSGRPATCSVLVAKDTQRPWKVFSAKCASANSLISHAFELQPRTFPREASSLVGGRLEAIVNHGGLWPLTRPSGWLPCQLETLERLLCQFQRFGAYRYQTGNMESTAAPHRG
jgi:hypothetical protein